jgi:hypothetical protein
MNNLKALRLQLFNEEKYRSIFGDEKIYMQPIYKLKAFNMRHLVIVSSAPTCQSPQRAPNCLQVRLPITPKGSKLPPSAPNHTPVKRALPILLLPLAPSMTTMPDCPSLSAPLDDTSKPDCTSLSA